MSYKDSSQISWVRHAHPQGSLKLQDPHPLKWGDHPLPHQQLPWPNISKKGVMISPKQSAGHVCGQLWAWELLVHIRCRQALLQVTSSPVMFMFFHRKELLLSNLKEEIICCTNQPYQHQQPKPVPREIKERGISLFLLLSVKKR